MEASQERIERVEKLNDDNYQFWSFQTKMFLQSKGLWDGIFDGSTAPEGPGVQLNEWKKRDRKGMNYIALSVDRANANLIYNLESGVEAWNVLREHHNMATLGSKLRTKKQLYSMKIVKTGSMYTHLNEMMALFNKLADVDGPMPENQKVITILSSIEPYYNRATSVILGWPEERLTVRNVKDYLVEEWMKLKNEPVKDSLDSDSSDDEDDPFHVAGLAKGF
jgi:hypothetical protein